MDPSPSVFRQLLVEFPSPTALGLVYPLSTLLGNTTWASHLRKEVKFPPKRTSAEVTTCAVR